MSQAIIDSLNLIRSKIFSGDDVITDNFVFCLHRMYSVSVLVVFSILLSLSQVRNNVVGREPWSSGYGRRLMFFKKEITLSTNPWSTSLGSRE